MNARTLPHNFVEGIPVKNLGVTAVEKQAVASIATQLLADLATIPDQMIHPAFNHDDLYIHRDTGEIVDVVGSGSIRHRDLKLRQELIPVGYAVCTGSEASRIQLWHKAEPDTRLICRERATELRCAYVKAQREDMARAVGVRS